MRAQLERNLSLRLFPLGSFGRMSKNVLASKLTRGCLMKRAVRRERQEVSVSGGKRERREAGNFQQQHVTGSERRATRSGQLAADSEQVGDWATGSSRRRVEKGSGQWALGDAGLPSDVRLLCDGKLFRIKRYKAGAAEPVTCARRGIILRTLCGPRARATIISRQSGRPTTNSEAYRRPNPSLPVKNGSALGGRHSRCGSSLKSGGTCEAARTRTRRVLGTRRRQRMSQPR
ncbi:hypothetical protein GGX14DRAFT_660508 [Mycena pura]|uniref:Uncharacterized protein n=1 Tax=Mycena pura TaxID=153505 RepID=A0AAD6Y902_9AGAR|nr:hypothetical protein GGX14DRAFT_660508 [Mycena pura]